MLSLTGARWELAEPPAHTPDRFSRVAAIVAGLRWGDSPLTVPSMDDLHDPFLIRNMSSAVARLEQALTGGERVRIITDYDVDGTTSSLILQATLRWRRPDLALDYHIPDRFDEGYGFSVHAAEKAAADGVQLIVTADIGVRDHAAVSRARELGVDVLICDHHLPSGESVPTDAIVLCPPQADCDYPNPALAACGVSLKLAQALLATDPKRDRVVQSLLKLAAIGTVADLVSLAQPENRAIVSLGLQSLNRGPHSPGLQALLDVSGLTVGEITAGDLGYRIGPRINAAGRIAHAGAVVELLTTRDRHRAQSLAQELDDLNSERRRLQESLVRGILADLPSEPDPFVVIAGPEADGWHRGIVGIVASRVREQASRPTAVISIQGELAVGSVRSVPSVHAVKALDSASDLLVRYGGHPMAAGFTVPTDKIDELRARLGAFVEKQVTEEELIEVRRVDVEIEPREVSLSLLDELRVLGPFGMGNPEPRVLLRGLTLQGLRTLGKDRSHLKGRLPQGMDVVWWRAAEHQEALGQRIDLLAKVRENVWRGRRTVQLDVIDARIARD